MNTFAAIVELLVGLVVFVTGMNLMSSGMKKSAGRGIKNLFKKINNNRLIGVGLGIAITAIIQSSGATAVMVIGFVNASIMSISQGLSIIFGACIGTTATGLLVSLSTFSFSPFLMLIAFIGFVLTFFKNDKVKNIGNICIGFGMLFFGIATMNEAFQFETIREATLSIIKSVEFPLLLVLIGAAFTAITQSSSATDGIVIVMIVANPDLLDSGLYLVLGATIGSVMPSLLASINSNVNAKRVSFTYLFIRTISALIACLVVALFQKPIVNFIQNTFNPTQYGLAIALFTLTYNIIDIAILIPFIKMLEKLSIKVVKDKEQERQKSALKYIDDNFLNTPSIAMMQVKREIYNMFDLSLANYKLGFAMMVDKEVDYKKEIEDRENDIDYINNAITQYLIKLSNTVNEYDEKRIGAYFHVINDIERIGDHAVNFLDSAYQLREKDLAFSEEAINEFYQFSDLILKMFDLSRKIFLGKDKEDLESLHELEDKTDKMQVALSEANFDRIRKHTCQVEVSPFYTTFVGELERIADHLTNVGYSVINPTGDEEVYQGAN